MILDNFIQFWKDLANQYVAIAPIICVTLGFLEALLPFLPLVVLIAFSISTMSMIMGPTMGLIFGILLPAIGSIIGVFLVFFVINKLIGHRLRDRLMKYPAAKQAINWVENRSDLFLMAMMSNPYAPIAIFNYGISLTNIKYSRYFKIVVFSRIIICFLLGLIGGVFNVHNDPKGVIWLLLSFALIYILLFLMRKIYLKRKSNENH